MIVGKRDPFGFQRLFYHPRSGMSASSIQQLLQHAHQAAGKPDIAAIGGFLNGPRLAGRTVLQDVQAVPAGHALVRSPQGLSVHPIPFQPLHGDLKALLRASLQQALDSGKRVALALSGGLDSALLLALLRELGAQHVPAYVLATGLPDYCEQDAALELAHRMGTKVKLVHVGEPDFVAALTKAVRHVEEPMFNLHPVAKLLLADAMAADGVELAISGDGADQVLRRDQSANYLPLCKALFDAASVSLYPPFLDPTVVMHLTSIPPDRDKQCLRALAQDLDLPTRLVSGPKHSRLAPAMDLGPLLERDRIHNWAAALDMPPPKLDSDTERVLWATLLLTLDQLGVENHPQ